jgi:hypothetical protein
MAPVAVAVEPVAMTAEDPGGQEAAKGWEKRSDVPIMKPSAVVLP